MRTILLNGAFAFILLNVPTVSAVSTVSVDFPSGLFPGALNHTEALFGVPNFDATIRGRMYYVKDVDHDACQPYLPAVTAQWAADVAAQKPVILLVDRGTCTFVTKVRHAQHANAAAVVILDSKSEELRFMSGDGTEADITIPSVMIFEADGVKLKDKIDSGGIVSVAIAFAVLQVDHADVVIWTSCVDAPTVEFKEAFITVATKLIAEAPTFSVTPKMSFINGSDFGCGGAAASAASACGMQCSNGGRYCAQDPTANQLVAPFGRDVVAENLRQMCLYQHLLPLKQVAKWFTYAVGFERNCKASFAPTCVAAQLTAAGLSAVDVSAVDACIASSGGVGPTAGVNTLIEATITESLAKQIAYIPEYSVNDNAYHGKTCSEPISLTSCPIVADVCDSYTLAKRPAACKAGYCWYTLDVCGVCVNAKTSPGSVGKTCKDCRGVANGGWTNDLCGICLAPTDANRDKACKDCAGTMHGSAMVDCKGKCPGTARIDACGRCLEPTDPTFQPTAGTACMSPASSADSSATDAKISSLQQR